jgi:hypothetical protein
MNFYLRKDRIEQFLESHIKLFGIQKYYYNINSIKKE